MIWREKRLLLIVLALVLLANAVFFFTYRVQYQTRLDELDQRLAQAESQLEEARKAHSTAQATLQGYRAVEKDVRVVYEDYWSTQTARLTVMIAEVKRLATASGLVPPTYAFERSDAQSLGGGTQRKGDVGATEVGVRFSVEGTYEQVRRLINLLELSRQFVIISQISLSTAEGNRLTLNLHLKTLFSGQTAEARPGSRL